MYEKKTEDVSLIKHVLGIFNCIGVSSSGNKYFIVLITFYVIGIAFYAKKYADFDFEYTLSNTARLLDILYLILTIVFSLTCLMEFWTHEALWNTFFLNMENFDCKLGRRWSIIEKSVCNCYLTLCLGSALILILCILEYSESDFHVCLVLNSISCDYVIQLQMFVSTFVLKEILSVIEKRFEILKRKTVENFVPRHIGQTFWNGIELKESHLIMINITKIVDKLFRQRILLLLIATFIVVLDGFQFLVLENLPQSVSSPIQLAIAVQSLLPLVSRLSTYSKLTFYLIMVGTQHFKMKLLTSN